VVYLLQTYAFSVRSPWWSHKLVQIKDGLSLILEGGGKNWGKCTSAPKGWARVSSSESCQNLCQKWRNLNTETSAKVWANRGAACPCLPVPSQSQNQTCPPNDLTDEWARVRVKRRQAEEREGKGKGREGAAGDGPGGASCFGINQYCQLEHGKEISGGPSNWNDRTTDCVAWWYYQPTTNTIQYNTTHNASVAGNNICHGPSITRGDLQQWPFTRRPGVAIKETLIINDSKYKP